MKYYILAQVYKAAQQALDYLTNEANDEDGFHRDCVISAVRSFQMAFNNFDAKKDVTPF